MLCSSPIYINESVKLETVKLRVVNKSHKLDAITFGEPLVVLTPSPPPAVVVSGGATVSGICGGGGGVSSGG